MSESIRVSEMGTNDGIISHDPAHLFSSSASKNPYLSYHRHDLNVVSDSTETVRKNRGSSSIRRRRRRRRRTGGGGKVMNPSDRRKAMDPSINSHASQYSCNSGWASEQVSSQRSKGSLAIRDVNEEDGDDDEDEEEEDDDGAGDHLCHSEEEADRFSSAQRSYNNAGYMNTGRRSGFHVLDIARSSARNSSINAMNLSRRRGFAEDNYSVKPWKLKPLNHHHHHASAHNPHLYHPIRENKISGTKAFSLQALEEYLKERASNPNMNVGDDSILSNPGQDAYLKGSESRLVLYSEDENPNPVSVRYSPASQCKSRSSRSIRASRFRRYLADQANIRSNEHINGAISDDHKYNDDDDDEEDEDNYSSYGSKSACCAGGMPWSTRSWANYVPISKETCSSRMQHHRNRHHSSRGSSCFPYTPKRARRSSIMSAKKGYYYALGNRHKWGRARFNSECCNNTCTSFSNSGSNSESSVTIPLMTEPEPCFLDSSAYTTDTLTEYNHPHPGLMFGRDLDRRRGYSRNKKLLKAGHAMHVDKVGMMNEEFHLMSSAQCTDLVSSGSVMKNERRSSSLVATSYRSWSQKHRPKSFRELIGQSMVVQTLYNAVVLGKIAPVYLFQGPRGTGKTSAARVFTAALNCLALELDSSVSLDLNSAIRPCGSCKECLSLNAGKNFDVREVNASGLNNCGSNGGIELGMKVLLKHISMPPTSSRYKVFIVDDCHLLSVEAWNVFMKNLEEPPPYVVFVLITTDPDALPRTALSCCQKFVFSKIRDVDIVSRLESLSALEKIDVDSDAMQLIASRADGSLHDAVMTLEQVSLLGKKVSLPLVQELVGLLPDQKLYEFLDVALSPDSTRTVKYIRDFMKSGVDPSALVSQLANLITDILAGKNKSEELQRLEHVMKMDGERFREALRILSDVEKQLRSCSDRSTWLTAAFLQFAQMGAAAMTNELTRNNKHGDEKVITPSIASKDGTDAQATSTVKNIVDASRTQCMSRKLEAGRFHKATLQPDVVGHNNMICCSPSRLSMGNRVYPCNNNQSSTSEVEGVMAGVKSNDNRHSSEQLAGSVDNIWRKVLGSTRSNVIKQLLRAEGRFLSLSVTEDHSVAHLEFKHPEHKALAEKARVSIAKAFQDALCCRVELKITLASTLSMSDIDLQKKIHPQVSKTGTKGDYPIQDDDEDMGKMRNVGKDTKQSSQLADNNIYCLRSQTEFMEKSELNVKPSINGDKEIPILETHEKLYDEASNELLVSQRHMLGEVNKKDGPIVVDQTKQVLSEREYGSSQMQEGNRVIRDALTDSPTHECAGGVCCWKGSLRSFDSQVKTQRSMRRRRRGRLLLKFVPCAKGEGTLN